MCVTRRRWPRAAVDRVAACIELIDRDRLARLMVG
jgi:hypothetical protein